MSGPNAGAIVSTGLAVARGLPAVTRGMPAVFRDVPAVFRDVPAVFRDVEGRRCPLPVILNVVSLLRSAPRRARRLHPPGTPESRPMEPAVGFEPTTT